MNKFIKSLLKDSVIYGSSQYIQKAIGILLIPVYTRIFTPSDYGVMDIVSVFMMMVTIICTMGLDSALARFYIDSKSESDRRLIASTVLYFRTALTGTVAVAVFLLAGWCSRLFFGVDDHAGIFRIIAAVLLANLVYTYSLSLLRFNFKAFKFALASVIVTLVTISLTIYFVIYARFGIIGVFYAQILALACVGAPTTFLMIRKCVVPAFSWQWLKKLLRYGLPLLPAAVSYWMLVQSSRYFLLHFSTLDQIGIFAVAEKFVRILTLLITGFQMAWSPFIFTVYKDKSASDVFNTVFIFYTAALSFVAVMVSLFGGEMIRLLTQPAYYEAYRVIPFYIFSPILFGAYSIVAIGVNLTNNTKYIGYSSMLGAGASLVFNFLFIPHFGIRGAALSTTLAYLLSVVSLYFWAQRVYPIPYRIRNILLVAGSALVIIIIGTTGLIPDAVLPAIIVKSVLAVAMVVVWSLTGLVPVKRILAVLHRPSRGTDTHGSPDV